MSNDGQFYTYKLEIPLVFLETVTSSVDLLVVKGMCQKELHWIPIVSTRTSTVFVTQLSSRQCHFPVAEVADPMLLSYFPHNV